MKILDGEEYEKAKHYINFAATIANLSKCLRSKSGSVIVNNGKIIGQGYNTPPRDKTLEHCLKDDLPNDFKSDKTCCIHAEQRAIINALKTNPQEIIGSRIYYVRLDEKGNIAKSGKPYCTICSKLALDVGIAEFVLWHEEGIYVYDTEEYNTLSFKYKPTQT